MSKDLPPELRELHGKMADLVETKVPVELTAKELALLGAAINAMQDALGEGIRAAPTKEASSAFVRMLTESGALSSKLETALRGVIKAAFGSDELPNGELDALFERMGDKDPGSSSEAKAEPFGFATSGGTSTTYL